MKRKHEIELFADYACEAGVVEVRAIYARRVTFYDPESRKPIRTVAVHTSSGSDLLVRQYLAAREEAITIAEEIRIQLDQRDSSIAAPVAE